ncbi:MAG: ribonuclease E/G, partial [Eubacterium sp.]|nr:ribonuclease E/G [Eubacterium sp.]
MNKELITACMPVREIPAHVTVLYEEGNPAEVYVEPEQAETLIGRIVIGKVESVSAGLSAAFVRTGADQRAYIPLPSDERKIRTGDEIAVQFVQEAQKTKLAKVSPDWELAGNYLVLSSQAGKPVCSKKLTAEQKHTLVRMVSEWNAGDCGILFRTRAATADPVAVRNEFLCLYDTVQRIRQKAASRSCFTVLYEA